MRTAARNPALGKTGYGCRTWIPELRCVLFVCALYIFLSAPAIAQSPERLEPLAFSPSQEVKPSPPQAVDHADGTALTPYNDFDFVSFSRAPPFRVWFLKRWVFLFGFGSTAFSFSVIGQCTCLGTFRQLASNKQLIVYT